MHCNIIRYSFIGYKMYVTLDQNSLYSAKRYLTPNLYRKCVIYHNILLEYDVGATALSYLSKIVGWLICSIYIITLLYLSKIVEWLGWSSYISIISYHSKILETLAWSYYISIISYHSKILETLAWRYYISIISYHSKILEWSVLNH